MRGVPRRQSNLPPISRGARWILLATTVPSLVFLLLGRDLQAQLAPWLFATGEGVWSQFRFWLLASSPLLEGDFVALLFQGLMLWLFLPTLERWWGTRRFLLFALWTSLAGVIAGTLAAALLPGDAVISGLDPFIYGAIVAFGVLFAGERVQFFGVLPMTGRQLAIGMVAFVALFVVLGQRWAEGASFAAAMLLAWGLTTGKWAPRLWYLKWKQKRLRRHLRVVGSDEPKRWLN
jgi:membrane associated rhomboid family serine protease